MALERFPIPFQLETRDGEGESGPVLTGYAVVYNSLSGDLGGFREQIAPGAFGDLAGRDVRAFWNHDPAQILGRTSAGTLTLADEKRGLRVTIHPPAWANGLVESVARGDVDAMSFGFTVEGDDWQNVEGGGIVRTVTRATLVEVSPVALPAYPQTSIARRALYAAPTLPESMRASPLENRTQPKRQRQGGAGQPQPAQENPMDKLAAVDMRRKAQALIDRAADLDALANAEKRQLSEDERGEYDNALAEHDRLIEAAARAEQLQRATADEDEEQDGVQVADLLDETPARRNSRPDYSRRNLNLRRGQRFQEERAVARYIRENDPSGLLSLRAAIPGPLTIGTPATAGYAVPTGLYQGVIAQRNEYMLADRLGVRRIPGKGTTVNVPIEVAHDEPFTLTAENATKTKDVPQLGIVAMTLKTYSKVVQLTDELIYDEDANLMAYIEDWIGRQMALTHNQLLVAAAVATAAPVGGTVTALPAGSAGAAAVADITTMVYALKEPYADNAKWVMQRATEGKYRALSGNPFVFMPTPQGSSDALWGAPVYNQGSVAALAINAKALLYGDWSYMGLREAPSFNFLRDPYGDSHNDLVNLRYFFRAVYACLNSEAIIVGQKAAT